jgi:hypothetical protein
MEDFFTREEDARVGSISGTMLDCAMSGDDCLDADRLRDFTSALDEDGGVGMEDLFTREEYACVGS